MYDIEAKDKMEFNRVKRRFYYYLNKLLNMPIGNKIHFISKSVIFADLRAETELNALFDDIQRYSDSITIFKLYTSKVVKL